MRTCHAVAGAALALGLVACVGTRRVDSATSTRQLRVLEADAPELEPVAFAAAAYLKSVTRGQIGFIAAYDGSYMSQRVNQGLTSDIITKFGFARIPPSSQQAPPCPGPVQPGMLPPHTGTHTCSNDPVMVAYSFSMFRIAADSAYVSVNGRMCFVLVGDAAGWKAVRQNEISEDRCGR